MAIKKCQHSHYADGHCAEMSCWNYHSKCPKHSVIGRLNSNAKCSRIVELKPGERLINGEIYYSADWL